MTAPSPAPRGAGMAPPVTRDVMNCPAAASRAMMTACLVKLMGVGVGAGVDMLKRSEKPGFKPLQMKERYQNADEGAGCGSEDPYQPLPVSTLLLESGYQGSQPLISDTECTGQFCHVDP